MALSDLITPVVADQLASFGPGDAGTAARLNYDVPLPGAYSWNRIVPLALDPDVFTDTASRKGLSMLQLGIASVDEKGGLTGIHGDRLARFYRDALPATVRPSLQLIAQVGGQVEPLLPETSARPMTNDGGTTSRDELLNRRELLNEPDDIVRQRTRVNSYLGRLAERQAEAVRPDVPTTVTIPSPGIGESVRPVEVDPIARPLPRIALMETWELRSYLGDYGLGRTLQTFSLLPGERTTITVQTWRSESATREDSSSIFDSSDTAAQTRFTSALSTESGSASWDQGGWAASVSTSASAGGSFLGIVHAEASVSAGFAANHQESSQQWSSAVHQAAREHAAQVNNSRRQSVQASSSSTSASGSATTTVRELSNTNLRRVLNFVFRELNQEYETYVVLRDIKVAFYNGRIGSADVVPLGELARLMERHVQPDAREQVAREILTLCARRIDAFGDVVSSLEVGTDPDGVHYHWVPASLGPDGTIAFDTDVLAPDVRWRFARHIESQDARDVQGVIMRKGTVVLRTDSMVVEALLGQADALDPYAAALQALDLERRQTEVDATQAQTRKTSDALALVGAQNAGEQIDAWQKLFPDQPEIEVVPVAAVNAPPDDDHHHGRD